MNKNQKHTENEYKKLAERQKTSKQIFDGRILHLYEDSVELPDGQASVREIIRHIGAVCIVPVTDEGNIVLERQFRYATGQILTEIPAGKLDHADEAPLDAAKRELKEETGYTADRWTELGIFYSAPAYSDEKITMFLATGLTGGKQELDRGEFLDCFEIPIMEAYEKVMNGEIIDSKTQVGILKTVNILH